MEIKDLKWDQTSISWLYDNKLITCEVENVIFGNADTQFDYVYVTSGEKFIETKFYYFSYTGNELLFFDKLNGIIAWSNGTEKVKKHFKKIIDVKLNSTEKLTLVLYEDVANVNKIAGYKVDGNLIFETVVPSSYSVQYLSSVDGIPTIVCEEENSDEFGRRTWHYLIDVNTGDLKKSNLAY